MLVDFSILQELLNRRGVKPRQLSLAIGPSGNYIGRILRGEIRPENVPFETVLRIARALNVPLEVFQSLSSTPAFTPLRWDSMDTIDLYFSELVGSSSSILCAERMISYLLPEEVWSLVCDTEQKNRASFEREGGASWGSSDRLEGAARTGDAARHASQSAE